MPNLSFRALSGKIAILFVAFVVLFYGTILRADDNAVIAEMGQKAVEIKKRMVASAADVAELARLQDELKRVMDEALPKLTPPTRALLEVSIKVIQPIQEISAAYIRNVGAYTASPKSDFLTIKSPADIDERVAMLEELIVQNERVLVLLNAFEVDCEKLLATANVPADSKREFMIGVNAGFGRQVGPMRAIRNLDTQAYRQVQHALQYLKDHPGKWQAGSEGFVWQEAALEGEFLAYFTELHALLERQNKAQEVLIERMQRTH